MARARSIGNVYAELSVRDKMTVGLKRASKAVNEFGSKAFVGISAGAAAAGTAISAALVAGTKKALDLGGKFSDISAQTGMAVSDAMKLERAFTEGGLGADEMVSSVAKMQKAIAAAAAGSPADDPFAALGLSAMKLMAMRPADQFKAIGDAIKAIENPTQRNAKAMEIFGKSGAKLNTVFGQFDAAAASLGRMPELTERFAESFDRASDILDGLPQKSDAFFVGFASGIIGEILPNLEKINQQDFTTLGENLGKAVAAGLAGLKDGMFWEAVSLKASAVIAGFSDDLATGFKVKMTTTFAKLLEAVGWDDKAKITFQSAYKMANQGGGLGKQMNDAADILFNELERRAKNKREPYDNPSGGGKGDSPPDYSGIVSPDPYNAGGGTLLDSLTGVLEYVDKIAREPRAGVDFQQTNYDVNELQRRGFGNGGENLAKQANDQVSLLKEIRDVLKRASGSGGLVWS